MQAHGESLNLFTDELVNKAITQAQYVDHLPISQSGNGVVEFNITPQSFIDLSRSQLYLKCKVVRGDNHHIGETIRKDLSSDPSEAADNESEEDGSISGKTLLEKIRANAKNADLKNSEERDVIPTNCLFGGLFQKVDLTIQQKNISNDVQTYTYPYKYLIDTLISTTQDIDRGKLFVKDECEAIDVPSFFNISGAMLSYLHTHNKFPPSLEARAHVINKSREFELQGPLALDFFQQNRLLLHNTNLGLKFYQSSPEFNLLTGEISSKFNVKIIEARLRLCHVNLDPAVTVAISDTLKLKPAQYPYKTSKIHTYSIAKGSTNSVIADLFSGQCPDKLFVFMVDSQNAAGNFRRNPYSFHHFNLSEIGFYVDNISLPSKPLKLDFGETASESNYIEAWQRLRDLNPNSIISYEDFHKGYSIFCFDLGNYKDLPILNSGTTKLELRFKSPLENSVTVFTYGQFKSCLSIDAARNVQ